MRGKAVDNTANLLHACWFITIMGRGVHSEKATLACKLLMQLALLGWSPSDGLHCEMKHSKPQHTNALLLGPHRIFEQCEAHPEHYFDVQGASAAGTAAAADVADAAATTAGEQQEEDPLGLDERFEEYGEEGEAEQQGEDDEGAAAAAEAEDADGRRSSSPGKRLAEGDQDEAPSKRKRSAM